MRRSWIAVLLLTWPASAHAGIYFTNPKDAGDAVQGPAVGISGVQALPLSTFQNALADWRKLRIPDPPSPLRTHFLAGRDRLQEKVRAGNATVDDQINLSAYLIHLGQPEQAIPLLENIARTDRQHATFMVYANLGTAYELTNELRSAADYLEQGLHLLKQLKEWPGIDKTKANWEKRNQEQLAWHRRAEEYQLKLVRIRRREAAAQTGRPKPPETVDDLFGVRFVGDNGTYQAGTLAAEQQKKLPPDALALVQQLLLWMPDDTRLYWLMGELMNAHGDIDGAKNVLDECSWSRGLNADELRNHRQILLEASQQKPDTPAPWLPDSQKLLIVGGGAGVLVLLLLYWQVRELFRRRLAK